MAMINSERFDEVEELIREGRYGKARHAIRGMLADMKQYPTPSFSQFSQDEKTSVVTGLLSDTLDMLLFFYHESQISLNSIKAARLLSQGFHPETTLSVAK